MPQLSILVPTFNRAAYLRECLESLASTTVDCEIVVSDNGSTDDTEAVLARYADDPRFRVFRQPENLGVLGNYDFLLGEARGRFICMFGDDDLALPGCFEAKLRLFAADPGLDFVYSRWLNIDEHGTNLGVCGWPGLLDHSYMAGRDEFADLMIESYIMLQSVVIRREVYEAEGGFRSPLNLRASHDWQMLVRFTRNRRTAFIAAPTVAVRLHGGSHTQSVVLRSGGFADDKLDVWRYWLLEYPTPLVLNADTWNKMRFSLAGDVARAFGDDPAKQAQYGEALDALHRAYKERHDRPVIAALTGQPASGPACSVVLVADDGRAEATRRCLEGIAQAHDPVEFEVIVVDNATHDGTADFLACLEGDVRIERLEAPLGEGAAKNRGAALATGRALVFVSNEAVPLDGWLSGLVAEADAHPEAAIVGALIVSGLDGRVLHAGVAQTDQGFTLLGEGLAVDDPQVAAPAEREMVAGACMLVKRQDFERWGGFDANEELEDLMLCLTARQHGRRVRYTPEARLWMADDAPKAAPAKGVAGIRFESTLLQATGYSSLARSIVLALQDRRVPLQAVSFGNSPAVMAMLERDPALLRRLGDALTTSIDAGTFVCLYPPTSFDGEDAYAQRRAQNPGFSRYVGMTMFETDRLPAGWAAACDGMDEVWVPSTFNRDTFARAGVAPSKLHVIPLGLDMRRYDPETASRLEIPGARGFTFLSVFQWTKRKGWDVLIKAYLSAFSAEDDVSLVLRTHLFLEGPSLKDRIDAYVRELGHDPDRIPRIVLLDGYVPDDQLAGLYASADAFVLPTRGEGWGIPYMEAMAMGKPTIATRWSAHLDFMSDETAYLIDVERLAPVDAEQHLENPFYTADQQWAEPSVAHTAALMRRVFTDRDEARAKGRAARAHIVANWAIERTAEWIASRAAAASVPAETPAPPPPPAPTGLANVLYAGPVYDPSGYADEVRHFVLGLADHGVPVGLRSIGRHSEKYQAQLAPAVRRQLDQALATSVVPEDFISVIHFLGGAFQRMPQAGYRIGRTMFETDGLPAEWVRRCNLMDEIWVPSDFNMATFRDAGVTTKLVKMPGGVDAARFRPGLAPRPIPGARGKVFLSVFEWSFRKGWDVLLQAWARAFGPQDDVTLVLRTYPLNQTEEAPDMDAWITRFLREGLRLERHHVAPIVVIKEQIPDAEMPALFAAASAYVAPSRGEGWGRPQMEAMACGLPVIATRWSGNLEFMTDENSLLIDLDGLRLTDELSEMALYHGQKWAEPSIAHMAALMRRVLDEPEAMAALGRRARQDVERHWTWERVSGLAATRLAEIAREIAERPPLLPALAPGAPGVVWEGAELSVHSFAHVNREVVRRLIASGRVEVSAVTRDIAEFKPDAGLLAVERCINRALTRPKAVTVRHQWPPDFTPPAEGAWVMMQPWEFGGLPDEWVTGMKDAVDEMWVYTSWLRDCYLRSGLPADRVHVVPLGVDTERFRPEGPRYPLKTRKRFKFLFLGGTIPRKGIDVLLEAYVSTFTADDDVCLVIKGIGAETFYSNSSPLNGVIRQLMDNEGTDSRLPAVEFLDAAMSDDEVASIYRACDALVHPYRGEGFGLPMAEAMASGLPVVVTGAGAAMDFCDETNAYLIPSVDVPIAQHELGYTRTGYWWAEPDREALGRLMREVVADPETARAKGRAGRARIECDFRWDDVADVVLRRLEALAAREPVRFQPPRPFRPGLAPWPLDAHRRVVFFHQPDWASGAWAEVLTSYARSLPPEADATLVLWLDPASGMSAERAAEALMGALAAAGLDPEAMPDVLLVPEPLDDAELARLYTAADWVVSAGDARQAERAALVGRPVLTDTSADGWRRAMSAPAARA